MFASLIWQLDSQQGILGASNQSPLYFVRGINLKNSKQHDIHKGLLGANQSPTFLCVRVKFKKNTAENLVLNQVYSVQIKGPPGLLYLRALNLKQ